jgi:transposase InsO family protein
LRTDAGSTFVSPRWKELSNMAGITLRMSGVEAQNSLGIGERMHGPLRRIYNKIRMDYPHIPARTLLKFGVKAMNDTVGENGLVPSLLVFGVIPRYPALNTELPNQKVRMEVIAAAQMEMNSIIAERRIATALAKNIPSAAEHGYAVEDEVLAFLEKESSWTGPFKVFAIADKILTIQSTGGKYKYDFNIQQLKPFVSKD